MQEIPIGSPQQVSIKKLGHVNGSGEPITGPHGEVTTTIEKEY